MVVSTFIQTMPWAFMGCRKFDPIEFYQMRMQILRQGQMQAKAAWANCNVNRI